MRKLYYLAIAVPIAIAMAYIILFHPTETVIGLTYVVLPKDEEGCIRGSGMILEERCTLASERIIPTTLVCNRYTQYFSTHMDQFFGKHRCNECSIMPPYQSICRNMPEAYKQVVPTVRPPGESYDLWRVSGLYPNEVLISTGSSVPPSHEFISNCAYADRCFVPFRISIEAGQTVSWINGDVAVHTITGGNPEEGPDGTFYSSPFPRDNIFEKVFETEGGYHYYCRLHPWMTGIVSVS